MKPKVPISLITGSLGSGKTTLLKNIIQKTDWRVAVLMNEFGKIAVDSSIASRQLISILFIHQRQIPEP
jgi:G3E family GTPase